MDGARAMQEALEVIEGRRKWAVVQGDCAALMGQLPSASVSLAFGSPPYCDARTYGIGAQRDCLEWVEWMLTVTEAAHLATAGPVFWVAAGVTRDRSYWPACEGLMWEWWKRGLDRGHELYRPCCWHRVGIPGSGQDDYLRADWEYVMCFKRPGPLAWSNNTAMGHPPKWAPGGEMSNRTKGGARVNQWGHPINSGATVVDADGVVRSKGKRPSHYVADQGGAAEGDEQHGLFGEPVSEEVAPGSVWGNKPSQAGKRPNGKPKASYMNGKGHTKRVRGGRADGDPMEHQSYDPPVLANPGNLVQSHYTADEVAEMLALASDTLHTKVGGGLMGHRLAHRNEAPFPERLAEYFVLSFCPPGGIVLDPFTGSGATAAVALRHNRRFIGIDLRQSQVDLTRRRILEVTPMMFGDDGEAVAATTPHPRITG